MWRKTNKWKVIAPVAVILVLAVAFWYGGSAPGLHGFDADKNVSAGEDGQLDPGDEAVDSADDQTGLGEQDGQDSHGAQNGTLGNEAAGSENGQQTGDADYSAQQGMKLDPKTGKDAYGTNPVPEGKPVPVEPQDAAVTNTEHTCTISISCSTILNHMDWLDPEKTELVPQDGWILKPQKVAFHEGESAFDVLKRVCREQKIHMEFSETPAYNSAYIEGINNLYEFDCGELSGWKYKVNDWYPNYGSSRYELKDGDVICWVYTCELGADLETAE